MKKFLTLLLVLTASVQALKAQQGFGTSKPAPSSVIDMTATNKGVLLPRVELTSITVKAPITDPADALTVFNTATAGTAPNNVTPGYYYWSTLQLKWIRLATGADATSEPWRIQTQTNSATSNSDAIYQTGNVAIGDFSGAASGKKLEVKGDFKSQVINVAGNLFGTEVNVALLPGAEASGSYWMNAAAPTNANFIVATSVDARATSIAPGKVSNFQVLADAVNVYSKHGGEAKQGTLEVSGIDGRFSLYASEQTKYGAMVKSSGVDGLLMYHANSEVNDIVSLKNRTEIAIKKTDAALTSGVTFNHHNSMGTLTGTYTFPKTHGATGDVMTKSTGGNIVWASPVATPRFFYAPSMILPTTTTDLPAGVTHSGTVFTVDLHKIYSDQFNMKGASPAMSTATRTAIKSTGAGTLPVIANTALEYFITYFDNTVYNPTTISLSDTGILTYEVLPGTVTAKTYMNIVFKVK